MTPRHLEGTPGVVPLLAGALRLCEEAEEVRRSHTGFDLREPAQQAVLELGDTFVRVLRSGAASSFWKEWNEKQKRICNHPRANPTRGL